MSKPNIDGIWGDEGGLMLVLTEMDGDRLSVAIIDKVAEKQLAAITIANYRVDRVCDFAGRLAERHAKKMREASDE